MLRSPQLALAATAVAALAATAFGAGGGSARPSADPTAMHTATAEPVPGGAPATTEASAAGASGPEAAATEAPSRPLAGSTIAVDPGHNGANGAHPTAIGESVPDGRGGMKACNTVGTETADGYSEHRFAWESAQVLEEALEDAGAAVLLSRTGDDGVGPCVDERGTFADEADALVSLHANGSEDDSARGFHVIAAPAGGRADDGAADVSEEFGSALVEALEDAGLMRSPAYEELVVRDDLATLNNASVPAVMLEAGEMRNAEDARMLRSDEGQELIAQAVVEALVSTLAD